ncbi:transcription termination factor MTEF18, mitochondrial-like [Iris pallida]|uniref:Transcription termination factor MTEF18, mitochondrial-like n=1 Tax=Iris pallida TaxID=29817 RepID=A0AAX6GUZ6_IRIPA|nr:transcription termination factor MTEF18, mitochondrial-like [Iris pallida]
MILLKKLRKPSPPYHASACWYSTGLLHGKGGTLINSACRNPSGSAGFPVKIPPFGSFRAPDSKGASFTKWAPLEFLKGRFLSSNRRFFCSGGAFSATKTSNSCSLGVAFGEGGALSNRACRNSLKASLYHTGSRVPSLDCLKDRFFLSNRQCFYRGGTFLPVQASKVRSFGVAFSKRGSLIKWASKTPSLLAGMRAFCNDASQEDPKPGYRGPRVISQAQAALTEYLHSTTGLDFSDAEYMSKNSPIFLDKLLNKVEKEEEIGRALSRFLRYHPINEFEPFFESIGLKPSEFAPFLPRKLMYLNDAADLVENYRVLCNYGIARSNIGTIYKEATEVFGYGTGRLHSKILVYEELGLSKTSVIKIVSSSPPLLIGGDAYDDFVQVVKELEHIGIKQEWMMEALSEKSFYDWGKILVFLHFCMDIGFRKEELGSLIRARPDFLLDDSGKTAFLLVGLLLKLGAIRKDACSLLLQFPHVRVGNFLENLRQGLLFLIELEMDTESIREILCMRTEFFGTHTLMKPNSLLTYLSTGKKRLRTLIKEDPDQLEKFVMGSKISRIPKCHDSACSLKQKKEFLLHLGFVEGSKEMQKALSMFRGKGDELQDRFDFLVKCGLDQNDVCNMIKVAPHILNQKVDVLEKKVNFLVHNLGLPLSSLVAFPSYMSYTVERVKLRFFMYNWLKERGKAKPALALSSVLACSDKVFAKLFISHHPQALEVWENYKKTLYSS